MFAQRLTAIATVLVFVQSGICAVRGDKAEYRGGTVTSIPKGAQGRIDADGPKEMIFRMNGGQEWRLPYASITALFDHFDVLALPTTQVWPFEVAER